MVVALAQAAEDFVGYDAYVSRPVLQPIFLDDIGKVEIACDGNNAVHTTLLFLSRTSQVTVVRDAPVSPA